MEASGLTEPEITAAWMAPEASPGPDLAAAERRKERTLLLVLATVQLANIMDFMLVMPLGPQLRESLKITQSQFGTIVSAYTFSACVAGLLAALVIDRFDRRKVLLTLLAGFTLATFSCGWATSFAVLVGSRIATGAFGGVLGALVFMLIGDVFPDSRRGQATGTVMMAFALASVAGVPFGLFLGNKLGWPAPFFMLGGLGVVVWIVAACTMPSLTAHIAKARGRNPARELFGLLTHPNHIRAFLLMIALMFGSFSVIPYLGTAMVDNVGISKDQLPLLYVLGGACAFFSSPLIGRWADKRGKLPVYRIMAFLSIIPFLALTNLNHDGLIAFLSRIPLLAHVDLKYACLYIAMLVTATMMVCNSARMVPAMAMITGSVEPSRRGGFMSVNSAVQHFAAGLGTQAAALILGGEQHVSPSGFRWVGIVSITVTLLSIPLAGRLRLAQKPAAVQPEFTATQDVGFAAEF